MVSFVDYFTFSVGLHLAVFWSVAIFFYGVQRHNAFEQCKLQKDSLNRHSDRTGRMFKHCLKTVLFNQWFVSIPQFAASYWFFSPRWHQLPDIFTIAFHMVLCLGMVEVGFYYSHRLFHSPFFYSRFHKWHHELKAPICIAALYTHPIEHAVCNMLPVLIPPLLLGTHFWVMNAWFCMATLNTLVVHSGYNIPGLPDSRSHDLHHSHTFVNFGVLGILDHLHGTKAIEIK